MVNFKVIPWAKTGSTQKRTLQEQPDRLTERDLHEIGSYQRLHNRGNN